jgi:argininosuccinate lyase
MNIDLENESLRTWIDEQSTALQQEMDFHIIADALVQGGWTSVKLNRFRNNQEAVDIKLWLEQNCTSEWKNLSTRYIFKKKKDAVWFILRWK